MIFLLKRHLLSEFQRQYLEFSPLGNAFLLATLTMPLKATPCSLSPPPVSPQNPITLAQGTQMCHFPLDQSSFFSRFFAGTSSCLTLNASEWVPLEPFLSMRRVPLHEAVFFFNLLKDRNKKSSLKNS